LSDNDFIGYRLNNLPFVLKRQVGPSVIEVSCSGAYLCFRELGYLHHVDGCLEGWELLVDLFEAFGEGAVVGVVIIVSFALIYFFPVPPSTITLATATPGSSFEYYGRRYQEITGGCKLST
jgi:hypothetical protein